MTELLDKPASNDTSDPLPSLSATMSVHVPLPSLDAYDLSEWTVIARKPREQPSKPWLPVEGAPVTDRQAQDLVRHGMIFMAQKKNGYYWDLMIMRKKASNQNGIVRKVVSARY